MGELLIGFSHFFYSLNLFKIFSIWVLDTGYEVSSSNSIIPFLFTPLIFSKLIIKEGLTPNFEILALLYSNTEFKSAIIKDLIFAVLFTVLGVSGIFKTLKSQAKNGEEYYHDYKNGNSNVYKGMSFMIKEFEITPYTK